jgi:hypothetical protein
MAKISDDGMVRLGDVADVWVGMATVRKEGGDALDFPVVQVGDIDDRTGVVRPLADLNRASLSSKAGVDRYLVQSGDVVVSCKGTLLKIGLIEDQTVGALATSNLVVVRSKGRVSVKTLYLVLQSEGAKRILRGRQKAGSTIASLSYRDIQTFQFRLPSKECQVQIAAVLDANREYVELTQKAMKTREELVQGLIERAFWGDVAMGGGR